MRTKKNVIRYLIIILLAISLSACSSVSVENDWDTSIDFSQFKTFTILIDKQPADQRIDQRVRDAIVDDMTSKGFNKVNSLDKADLAVGYLITTEQRTSSQNVHTSIGISTGFSRGNVRFRGTIGTGSTRSSPRFYTQGTLVITMYTADKKEVIWEGSASDTIDPSQSPDAQQQIINTAVKQILNSFPP